MLKGRASHRARQVKAPATKPGKLTSILRTHTGKGGKQILQVYSNLHESISEHKRCTTTHTNIHTKQVKCNFEKFKKHESQKNYSKNFKKTHVRLHII